MNAIDERPSKDALLADLLPYEAWESENRIFWLKDGSASRTIAVTPRSSSGRTEDELDILRSGLTNVLNQVPEGVSLQFLFIRERTTEKSDIAAQRWINSHRTSEELEVAPRSKLLHAKKESLETFWETRDLYQSRLYVTIRVPAEQRPLAASQMGAFSQLAFLMRKRSSLKEPNQLQQELLDITETMRTALIGQGFEVRDPDCDELLHFVYKFLNPERSAVTSFSADGDETISDLGSRLALTDLFETREGLRLGRVPLRIATLKALPDSSVPCLSSLFSATTSSFSFVMTVLVLPQTSERERLSRKQRLTQGMAAGNRVRNLVAETQLQEIEETLSAMIASGEKLVAASFHLIASGEENTKPEAFATMISRAEELGPGCQWFEETVGAYPTFFGTMPFAPTFIPRPKRVLTSVLSDFLPLFGMPPGHERAEVLFDTLDASLLGYSLFEKSPSANAVLIGSSGSGKSTLACGLILGMAAGNHEDVPSSYVIDVGNSFKRSLQYLGGASLDLSPEKGARINPFDLPLGVVAPDPEKVKFLTAFFDEVLGDQGALPKLERALLETEILRFYETDSPKNLSCFKRQLEKSESPEMRRLSQLLELWCQPHPYGLLFDGETNIHLNAPHLHFELKGCQRYPDLLRVAMLVVMDLIWREVRSRFPRRSLIVIDEAHTVIRSSSDGRSNSSARWVEDCFRQMRKFSSAAIAISQTAKDLKNDEIGDGILANAPNRFILRQRGDEKTLKEDLKLNAEELKSVFALNQVRGAYSEFFLHSESIKNVLIYRPTPLELWLSTTHPPDLKLLEEERAAHPELSPSELVEYLASHYPQGAEVVGNAVAS